MTTNKNIQRQAKALKKFAVARMWSFSARGSGSIIFHTLVFLIQVRASHKEDQSWGNLGATLFAFFNFYLYKCSGEDREKKSGPTYRIS
jgi:hypothetical protein